MFRIFGGESGQGGGLSKGLAKTGIKVFSFSRFENRFVRMLHIIIGVIFRLPKANLVILHSFGLKAFIMEDLVTEIAVIQNKPVVFRIHGGAFIEFLSRHPKWVRRVLRRAIFINTPSRYLQDELIKLGFKVEYLPNFINLHNFPFIRTLKHRHSLLWVRAFHEIYHPELAIQTVSRLRQKYSDVKLTMIGPDQGSMSDCLDLIKELDIAGNINLLGYVPNIELYKYYQSCQVFLTTTRYESFGVALVEAGGCGIPCVCVPVGEIPYIWTDRENILFAERDPGDFADKVTELFENSALANRISINASKNAQKYTWENVKPMWLETIERLSKIRYVRN